MFRAGPAAACPDSGEELNGRAFVDRVHPAHVDDVTRFFEQCLQNGEGHNFTFRFLVRRRAVTAGREGPVEYTAERRYVQLRWEMFNATNHVNLNDPGTQFGISTFGLIQGAGPARQMQFALKIVF